MAPPYSSLNHVTIKPKPNNDIGMGAGVQTTFDAKEGDYYTLDIDGEWLILTDTAGNVSFYSGIAAVTGHK